MTKLEKLAAACKGGMSLEANPHWAIYVTSAAKWLATGMEHHRPETAGPPPEEMEAINAGATLWALQWYPNSPIGFHRLFGANLERMLDEALRSMGLEP